MTLALPMGAVNLIGEPLFRLAESRPPDFVVGQGIIPYLERWYVIPRNPLLNVYLHHFCRSDDDRALHDHPWPSVSLNLRGYMFEHTFAQPLDQRERLYEAQMQMGVTPTQQFMCQPIEAGHVRFRSARFSHRLELPPGQECWTLFLTGPALRTWGFWCDGVRWVDWRKFTDTRNGRSVTGRSCE